MHHYIGIDPGLKGAISVVDSTGELVDCIQLPSEKEESRTGRKISRPDIVGMINVFDKLRLHYQAPKVVMIEKQVAMPGQNSIGTFNTGKGYGILLALIAVYFGNSKRVIIDCKEWQQEMIPDRTLVFSKLRRDKRKQLKKDSVAAATELFPKFRFKSSERSKVDNDGMTDSALIAAYCYKKFDSRL